MQDMAEGSIRARSEAVAGQPCSASVGWVGAVLRNVLVGALFGGIWLALETGYFSNDRKSRAMSDLQERLQTKPKGTIVYEAKWKPDLLSARNTPEGYWDYYNGATGDTASASDAGLEVRYTTAWIGAYFRHVQFKPNSVYRVVFEANVEQEPAAILMRNRQLDLLREPIPVTNGEFKEFKAHYVAPAGSMDQVRVIFMPDGKGDVSGKLTIRKLRIERLDG